MRSHDCSTATHVLTRSLGVMLAGWSGAAWELPGVLFLTAIMAAGVCGCAQTGASNPPPSNDPQGTLSANPVSISFGNVDVGSSASQTVTVKNTGSSNVSLSSVTLTGSGYAASGLSSNEVLGAGQSASLTVVFAPTSASGSTGDIQVASNAANSPLSIALSGTGVPSQQHSVTLSWTASTSSVAGYNVYRGTVSGGPYTLQLNNSLITGLSFTDNSAQAGATYYYVAVAVNSSGTESAYSNQASATVP
jgi:hypothetical protein